jgi:hypothetical protein
MSNLFFALLLFIIQNAQVLFMLSELFPLYTMTFHNKSKLLFLSINPLIPLRILPSASLEVLRRQRL